MGLIAGIILEEGTAELKKNNERFIIAALCIGLAAAVIFGSIHAWNRMYYANIANQMDCGLPFGSLRFETLDEDRGGITNDGTTTYQIELKHDDDIESADFSEWNDLPIDEGIAYYYGLNQQPKGPYLVNLKNGKWKVVGKNKEDGVYRNILLYVYDADECEFYAYKWDS